MKRSVNYQRSLLPVVGAIIIALVSAWLLAGCSSGLVRGGHPDEDPFNPGVWPPNSKPGGKTYGEWSGVWWAWALNQPLSHNPIVDLTGQDAHWGQSEFVSEEEEMFFLVGTYGEAAERACSVPAGKSILFPIENEAYLLNLPTDTEEEARRCIRVEADHVATMEVTVDGRALGGLRNYRFQSPGFFAVNLDPQEPLWPGVVLPADCPTVADGYWICLEPLENGEHTVTWYAKKISPAEWPDVNVFEQTIIYHLTVQ